MLLGFREIRKRRISGVNDVSAVIWNVLRVYSSNLYLLYLASTPDNRHKLRKD